MCAFLLLELKLLGEVIDTFVTLVAACGVPEYGEALTRLFWARLVQIARAFAERRDHKRPTVLLLKWLDLPFDAGHWIPNILARTDCAPTGPISPKHTPKLLQLLSEDHHYSLKIGRE